MSAFSWQHDVFLGHLFLSRGLDSFTGVQACDSETLQNHPRVNGKAGRRTPASEPVHW